MVTYSINQFNSQYTNNRWFYIDSYDGNLSLRDNKWFFDLNLYTIYNGNLPVGMLQANLETPIFNLNEISLNEITKPCPDWVNDKTLLHTYSLSTIVDINSSGLLTNLVSEYNIYTTLTFSYDANIVNKTTWTNTPNLDAFFNELNSASSISEFTYSNYEQSLANSGWLEAGEEYYINSKTGYAIYSIPLVFKFNDYQDNELQHKPIVDLVTLACDKTIKISDVSVTFNYTIDGNNNVKQYVFNDVNVYYLNKELHIVFDEKTMYNIAKQIVEKNDEGDYGFYVPTICSGYYDIRFKARYKYNSKQFKIINSFKFTGDSYANSYISCYQTFIEDPSNFSGVV